MSHSVVRVGIASAVRNKEGKLLVGKRKGSHGEGEWSTPGGHLELWESFEECAARELMEETSLKFAKNPTLGTTFNNPWKAQGKHYITIFMEGQVEDESKLKNAEPHKCEGWEWVSEEDLFSGKYTPLFHPVEQYLEHLKGKK